MNFTDFQILPIEDAEQALCVVVAPRIGQTKWPNQDLSDHWKRCTK